jgi:hypothetical protein
MHKRLQTWLLAVLLLAGNAHAGRSCEQRPMTPQTLTQGMALAQQTAQALDAEFGRSGARVVALGRAGQDLGAYQLRYSHLGWAYKSTEGPWRVLHKLNQCGTGTGSIYRQGLGEFFLDDLWRFEAVWAVPAPALQAPLWAVLNDPEKIQRLHERAYNMVAYTWATRYQQSNQWAIETLALAAEPGITNRAQAQAWLGFKGYRPSTLRLGPLTRLGASTTSAHIRFDDHPNAKRFSDRIETVTVDSVLDWLARSGLGSAPQRLAL